MPLDYHLLGRATLPSVWKYPCTVKEIINVLKKKKKTHLPSGTRVKNSSSRVFSVPSSSNGRKVKRPLPKW